jgi:hypothetical protein
MSTEIPSRFFIYSLLFHILHYRIANPAATIAIIIGTPVFSAPDLLEVLDAVTVEGVVALTLVVLVSIITGEFEVVEMDEVDDVLDPELCLGQIGDLLGYSCDGSGS